MGYFMQATYAVEVHRPCGGKWLVTTGAMNEEDAMITAKRAVSAKTGYSHDSFIVQSIRVKTVHETTHRIEAKTLVENICVQR